MQFFLLALLVVLAIFSSVQAGCDSNTKESACLSASADGQKCSWCTSAAVGATCFPESDAKSLPSSVFQCEYQKAPLKTTGCDGFTSEKTCMSGKSNGENCAWCNSAAVGGACFVTSDAKSLPSSVFQCEFVKEKLVKDTTCDVNTSKSSCLGYAKETCAWCSSAAVGSTCFPEADAKSLPSSVFQCDYKTSLRTSA